MRQLPSWRSSALADGWIVMLVDESTVSWSCAPSVHPSAVRRAQVKSEDGSFSVETAVHCEAERPAREELVAEYDRLEAAMATWIEHNRQPQGER